MKKNKEGMGKGKVGLERNEENGGEGREEKEG